MKRNVTQRATVLAFLVSCLPVSSQTERVKLELVGQCDSSGGAIGVAVAGNYAYLADSWAGLQVIDVSDSANPQRVGGFDTGECVNGVAISGNYAYVVDGDLEVLDITDPANPRRVGGHEFDFGGAARHVAVSGNYVLVTEGYWWDGTNDQSGALHVIDISDPANPQRLGRDVGVGTPSGVAVADNYACVLYRREWGDKQCVFCPGDLEVIDISNPVSPQELGRCETMSVYADFGVAVSGNYAYVAGGGYEATGTTNGLQIIDISNPANPRKVGFCGTYGFVGAVLGNYAYLCEEGLQVIDVSNPTSPQRVGGVAGYATAGVALHQGKVFVAGREDGLLIYETLPFIKSISKEGQHLSIAWEGFGPAKLQRATSLTNPDWQDMLGSENTNAVSLPIWGGTEFFRLVKP